MLGWDIIVRRQRENRTSPIANPSLFGFGSLEVAAIASSPVVARWQAHTGGLGWLDALVKKGNAPGQTHVDLPPSFLKHQRRCSRCAVKPNTRF